MLFFQKKKTAYLLKLSKTLWIISKLYFEIIFYIIVNNFFLLKELRKLLLETIHRIPANDTLKSHVSVRYYLNDNLEKTFTVASFLFEATTFF